MGVPHVNSKQGRQRIYAEKIRWIFLISQQRRLKINITRSNKKINKWNLFLLNEKKYTRHKTHRNLKNEWFWIRRFDYSRLFGIQCN